MSKEFICKGCGEKFNKDMQSNNVGYCYICNEFYMRKQVADLEAKLVEKDRQIEQLKKFDDLNKTFFDLFRTAFKEPNKVDDLFNTLKTMQEKQDQDKISFCIEQLEKVKAELVNKVSPVKLSYNEYVQGVFSKIDNQIKQLKEMK